MKIEYLKLEDIKPYDNNQKHHSIEQIEEVAKQIAIEWDQPIVIDENNVIIKGHARLMAAYRLKMEKAPCYRRSNLNEGLKRAIRIADNKVAESPWDFRSLEDEIKWLQKNSPEDLNFTGFGDDELLKLLSEEPKDKNNKQKCCPNCGTVF